MASGSSDIFKRLKKRSQAHWRSFVAVLFLCRQYDALSSSLWVLWLIWLWLFSKVQLSSFFFKVHSRNSQPRIVAKELCKRQIVVWYITTTILLAKSGTDHSVRLRAFIEKEDLVFLINARLFQDGGDRQQRHQLQRSWRPPREQQLPWRGHQRLLLHQPLVRKRHRYRPRGRLGRITPTRILQNSPR